VKHSGFQIALTITYAPGRRQAATGELVYLDQQPDGFLSLRAFH